MDGGGGSQAHRAEAERWLTAAAKLLATRDFHGARTFAIRVRESDPGLDLADHMLAVVDVLLAGESRVVSDQPDWYAVLQLGHFTQNLELIASHFRRLAVLLAPDRNRFPFADQALRLASDAWSVLSSPGKKAAYDSELKLGLLGQLGNQTPPSRNVRGSDGHAPPAEDERPFFGNGTPVQPRPIRPASQATESASASFWTACPYCFYLYEYPRVYAECVLRCQNCKRAFQAVAVPSPPVSEKDTHFSCWGFFPIGFPGLLNQSEGASGWMPMSPMVACPAPGQEPTSQAGRKGSKAGQKPAPRVYYDDDDDDDDVYVELSESSEDSGEEWGSKRKTRRVGKKSLGSRSAASRVPIERTRRRNADVGEQGNGGIGDDVVSGTAAKGGDRAESSKKATELSKKPTGSSTRKQSGKAAMGKLDLNVEFSNEVEEPARVVSQGNRTGNGEEDNIEGTGFFEGLDEFLSSLPILSVVNDDKVKAS
ncbi:uncharacterized protein LOC104452917 [Eucalyptus grandis]|uniref:uncharacterized protein LOC104452917 n=1 Tax=Eucalyptus grandis TaxID=71139 RepID=UPI00192E9D00|nr:uncharacterized protein LOC104452917 [Eucalyptus grandis]